MAKTVFANGREVAHGGNDGISIASPNVCMTPIPMPSPPGQIPIPYPSIAKSKDVAEGPTTVKVEGKMPLVKEAKIETTDGDKPGKKGGVSSGCNGGPAELVTYSFDVKFEGRNVGRLGDSLFHNKKNAMG